MASDKSPVMSTGSVDWSEGVDSLKPTTLADPILNVNGLTRNQLAWLVNATMRGGPLSPRDGYNFKGNITAGLLPQIIPGSPPQTIPQPPTQVQTAANQNLTATENWEMGISGAQFTINVNSPYVGNVGDNTLLTSYTYGDLGTAIVISFTSSQIVLQGISTTNTNNSPGPFELSIRVLGPPVPQPPIVIPAGQSTSIQPTIQFQGGIIYSPNSGKPYGMCVIGGHLVQFDPDFGDIPIDLSFQFGLYFPITPRCFFCQAQQFLVIQAGDYDPVTGNGTLPLFWDGQNLTRSNGITGVLARGTPTPASFQITITQAWTPPADGDVTPILPLATAYPGNLGDNITMSSAVGNNLAGVFRVVTVTAVGIALETLSSPASGQAANTAYVCTFVGAGDNAIPYTSPDGVVIGAGSWTIPAVGKTGKLTLTSAYFGSAGDTITIASINGSVTYGTFTVVSFASASVMFVKTITSPTPGQVIYDGSFLFTVTACRAFSQSLPLANPGFANSFTIAAVGGVSNIYWPAFDGQYNGYTYDNISLTGPGGQVLGQFRVVAQGGYFNQDHNYPYITVQTLASNFVGNSYNSALTATVIVPPSNPQIMVLDVGMWTVPAVGQNVTLQLVWGGSLGPLYPGNVGDQIILQNTAPNQSFGTYNVISFDALGNITLQLVTASTYFPPGTTVVGPTDANIIIEQLPSTTGTAINQIPAATCMVYYQGILWYAQGDIFSGGDVVGGPSGTSTYDFEDSVLCVTENPLAFGGDGFKLPIPGNITGMAWPAQINASLGQGLLYIGTLSGVCSLQVPTNRQAWIAMNSNALPQLNVVRGGKPDQAGYGFVNDWAIVPINGDLYSPSIAGDIFSLIIAERYFQQQGNVSISSNEARLLDSVNTALLNFASGIFFNNRLLMAMYPQQTPYGVIHPAIVPLDLEPISTIEEQLPPNWEGAHEGLQTLQLVTNQFSGVQRGFAITLSAINPGEIDLYEIIPDQVGDNTENGNNRITWQATFPGFTWEKLFELKQLQSAELWIDDLKGVAEITVEYSPDGSSCYYPWIKFAVCSAADSTQIPRPYSYPVVIFHPGVRRPLTLPKPPSSNEIQTGRPSYIGYEMSPRITVKGNLRLRGLVLFATKVDHELGYGMVK